MRTRFLLLAAVATSIARGDLYVDPKAPVSAPPPPAAAPSPEDARTAALEQRFAQGKSVEAQGQLQQALGIFDGIIHDAPDAKGSLREAGLISVELGDNYKADDYFSKLHALVPDYPMAIEELIQVNQALKRDAKVEILLKSLKTLWDQGKVVDPRDPNQRELFFVRERIHLDSGTEIKVRQFFDYHQPPYCAWMVDVFDAQHRRKRWLAVNYDPEVTANMRKDPKLANAEQFLVVDNVMDGEGNVVRVDCYQQFLALPDYYKMRTVLLEILTNALKPIDSAPVPQRSSGQPARSGP